ncbi:hypothetical protein [Streptomyces sp. NPDC005407]|uniref:hypothetical protein n=1 Tax=Streptomyces sp. NPDC005407 TaxID=3155340 RepID=UPI0033A2838A
MRRLRSALNRTPTIEQISRCAPRGTGLSPSLISSVLSGKKHPSREAYVALVRVLLAYDTGKVASLQHPELAQWIERWQRCSYSRNITRSTKGG